MKTMSTVEVKTHFTQFLNNAQKEPILVTKQNHPIAIILSMQDIENTTWAKDIRKNNDLTNTKKFKEKIKAFKTLNSIQRKNIPKQNNIADFFMNSSVRGLDVDLERDKSLGRDISFE